MKILALTSLYPPHNGGIMDNHCPTVVQALRLRGHNVLVLTSNHGIRTELREENVHRRLQLNGVLEHPLATKFLDLKPLEVHNHAVLMETIQEFQPDIVHVFSLHGLSKSLIFTLRNSRVPAVYDVYDYWLSAEIMEDPWLKFWNSPSLPFFEQSARKALEMSGERGRLDDTAPTRMHKGYDRLPIFGDAKTRAQVAPNSLAGFPFDRLYFCSGTLKELTERVGFCVGHADIIYPCISTQVFFGELKPATAPIKKFLIVGQLNRESGVLTALKALKRARAAKLDVTLSVYGRGDSKYLAELRSFVVSNQLPVEFLTVPNQNTDLSAIYKKHDALIHPVEWAEPFPFTPLEAMACGLPVIGTASRGAEELLRHGENAFTYPPGDDQQLAIRVQELLISPALRCQIAETAQAEVLAKFNDSTVMDQLESFLNFSIAWGSASTDVVLPEPPPAASMPGQRPAPVRDMPPQDRQAVSAGHGDSALPTAQPVLAVIGDFELFEELGRGGMGVVYKARQRSLNRWVAVKMIKTGDLATAAEVKRFKSEAKKAANLDHPNVVPIYMEGEYRSQHYYVMKLIEGGSLAEKLDLYVADRAAAVQLLATVAHAVDAAHKTGVLHRDLKPGNILLDKRGQPHITDFGLARELNQDYNLAVTATCAGTPRYMAPEQVVRDSSRFSAATDVWGLGNILYELLTGQPAFGGGSDYEVYHAIVSNEPPKPSAWDATIDADIEAICMKCLQKKSEDRYQSAEDLALDLERWIQTQKG
jgi:glycogen(starch) synthase